MASDGLWYPPQPSNQPAVLASPTKSRSSIGCLGTGLLIGLVGLVVLIVGAVLLFVVAAVFLSMGPPVHSVPADPADYELNFSCAGPSPDDPVVRIDADITNTSEQIRGFTIYFDVELSRADLDANDGVGFARSERTFDDVEPGETSLWQLSYSRREPITGAVTCIPEVFTDS